MIRVAQYTCLAGPTVVVTFEPREVLKAGGKSYASGAQHVLAVLRQARTWNITGIKPSLHVWRDQVPGEVAEGMATAMLYAAAGKRPG